MAWSMVVCIFQLPAAICLRKGCLLPVVNRERREVYSRAMTRVNAAIPIANQIPIAAGFYR